MRSRITQSVKLLRYISTSRSNPYKVTICGCSGLVGQSLALLVKMHPLVTDLACYDIAKTAGVAADLSHISTKADVRAFEGPDNLTKALHCADIVVIPASIPTKAGMTRADFLTSNAGIIKTIICAIAKVCPTAFIAIISNPVNSLIPLAAEVMKATGAYDPKRLFGVTTLDVVRSKTFIGQHLSLDPEKIKVHVIGGHSSSTILPVLSGSEPKFSDELDEIAKMTKRIQSAGDAIVKAKDNVGSATLSMGFAGAHFTCALLRALDGDQTVVECSYVESKITDAAFFATPLKLSREGIKENLGMPRLSAYELKLLDAILPKLKNDIQRGIDYAKK